MLKTIDQALDYLYSFINLESKSDKTYNKSNHYSLENIKNILFFFNNPHEKQKIIHIAGTKGKGSTALMISKLLSDNNIKTSTFISPHLLKPNERFLFNMNEITDNELIYHSNILKNVISKHNLKPTTFELFFILFLLYSLEKSADYLVVETGLGGRLDCTNVVLPVLTVITPISKDHTNILGKTIKKIAYEKAGIIKKNIPLVYTQTALHVKNILKKTAKKNNSEYFDIHKYFKLNNLKATKNGIIIDFDFKNHHIKNFYLPLYGKHQIYNFFTSLFSVYLLNKKLLKIILNNNTLEINLPGRIQVINKNPEIIVDTAHNKDSAKKIVQTLQFHFPEKKWCIAIAIAKDKDYKNIINEIKKIANKIIITSCNKYKNSDPDTLYCYTKKKVKNTILIKNNKKAFDLLISNPGNKLITGSFYISGPFLEYYYKLKKM